MAEDLGELLDEVERKFCSPKTTPTTTAISKVTVSVANPHGNCKTPVATLHSTSATSPAHILSEDDDLEQIISEIINDSDFEPEPKKRGANMKKSRNTASPVLSGKRCYPVLLAGASMAQGYSDGHNRRACDRLRCTSCDFHVISFSDHAWHTRSNSLFFRNSMPDTGRLRENLVSKKGCRAYACQCSWRSVEDVEELERGAGRRGRGERRDAPSVLKWVCGKH